LKQIVFHNYLREVYTQFSQL